MAKWYSTDDDDERERIVGVWPEAPFEQGDLLDMLVEVARGDVLEYAPAPPADADWDNDPPARLVLAQLRQMRNLWDAGRVDSDGGMGDGGFVFVPRPMDADIKKIIRPASGGPDVAF